MSEDRLDEALNSLKNEEIPSGEAEAARARIWRRLAGARSEVCAGFRADLEAYRAGTLEAGRRLLLEDHLARCAACRTWLAGSKPQPEVRAMPERSRRAIPAWARWAVAAGLAAAALYLGRDPLDRALAPSGPRATVVSVRGGFYGLTRGSIKPGDALGEGELVRTAMGGRAILRLRDGSLVEMNERTELAVQAAWSGQTVKLERGDVIVQAAKQRRGRLRVVTHDSTASVKGTIFGVSGGLAGSLVSVVEGSVEVRQPSGRRILTQGQQAASTPALAGVTMENALGWGENAAIYFAILKELAGIESRLAAMAPPPRTESRLLGRLPGGAFLYFAQSNPGPFAGELLRLLEERAAASPELRQWLDSGAGRRLRPVLEKIQELASMLGEEIVFVLLRDPAVTERPLHCVMAEVNPASQASLEQALKQTLAGSQGAFRVIGNLLLVSDSAAHLDTVAQRLGQGAASPFAAEIAARYQNGVNMLAAADLANFPARNQAAGVTAVLGATNLKYISVEQGKAAGSDQLQVLMQFDGPRTGMASWLGSPGVAGSAEYVSSEAVMALSAATRNPRQAFDEFVSLVGRVNPRFPQELNELESRVNINVSQDIISALGSDFTFSVERPSVPIPGWVAAVEVNQPGLLETSIRTLVEAANNQLQQAGEKPRLSLTQEQADGRQWTVLRNSSINLPLYWTFDRGYWVISPDRTLALQAIATRNGGFPLIRSAQFLERLPAESYPHYSGFFWLNPKGAVESMAAMLGQSPLRQLLASREPVLVVASAETERIRAVSRTRLMSILMTMALAGEPQRARQAGNGTAKSGN